MRVEQPTFSSYFSHLPGLAGRRCPLLRASFLLPPLPSPPCDGVAGWADQLLLRASTEHILIVRGLRARKLAARLAVIATPSPHTLSLAGIDSRNSYRPDSVATILKPE